jgi:hypothetical protein
VVAAEVDSVAVVDAVPAGSAIAGKRSKTAGYSKGAIMTDGTLFLLSMNEW